MTLTDRSMEWLNQNRRRSYPMRRDEWREVVSPESGLDCVILDALVFDPGRLSAGSFDLEVSSVEVSASGTVIRMKYAGVPFEVSPDEGTVSGEGSFSVYRGMVAGTGGSASVSVVTSSHAFILSQTGVGSWEIGCKALGSRVARLSDGYGVDGIATAGSEGVDGHGSPSVASGEIVLEDGYRTSPVVSRGAVLVRVGTRYGKDPCGFDFGDSANRDCRRPLLFFCGQNAINGGNIVLSGGIGVSVSQGRNYTVRSGTCKGKTIPCIEIVAGKELKDLYVPEEETS